jgi:hypothetical protein
MNAILIIAILKMICAAVLIFCAGYTLGSYRGKNGKA